MNRYRCHHGSESRQSFPIRPPNSSPAICTVSPGWQWSRDRSELDHNDPRVDVLGVACNRHAVGALGSLRAVLLRVAGGETFEGDAQ